jgi:hypothetical protein
MLQRAETNRAAIASHAIAEVSGGKECVFTVRRSGYGLCGKMGPLRRLVEAHGYAGIAEAAQD